MNIKSSYDDFIAESKFNYGVLIDALRPHGRLLSRLGTTAFAGVVIVGGIVVPQPLRNVLDSELKTTQNSIYARLPALDDSGPAGTEAAAAVNKFCSEVGCGGKGGDAKTSALEHRGTQWVHRDENTQALSIPATRDSVDWIVRKNSLWTYFAHPERAAAMHELDRSLPHVSQVQPSSATGPKQ